MKKLMPAARRLATALLLCALQPTALRAAVEAPPSPILEFLFTATVQVGTPLTIEPAPEGVRRYVPILGGSVAGPKIRGKIMAAGGDTQVVRADGVIETEALYTLLTDDNVLISVTNHVMRHAPPAVAARLAKGEHVDPGEYYFRGIAQLVAPVGSRYEYVNQALFVATGEREPSAAYVHFFRIR